MGSWTISSRSPLRLCGKGVMQTDKCENKVGCVGLQKSKGLSDWLTQSAVPQSTIPKLSTSDHFLERIKKEPCSRPLK